MVRRDNFPLLPRTMREAVSHLMQCDVVGALQVVSDQIKHLRTSTAIDMQDVTISKELTKPPSAYAAKPPHVMVATRIPHNVKDRVQYVIAHGHGKIGDRAKHPTEMQGGEIDRTWYVQQMIKSFERLLKLCCTTQQLQQCMHAGLDNEIITQTSTCTIAKQLGVQPGIVWRKRTSVSQTTSECTKKARQSSLNHFLGI